MRYLLYIVTALLMVTLNYVEATPRESIPPKERVFIVKRPDGTLYIKRVPAQGVLK